MMASLTVSPCILEGRVGLQSCEASTHYWFCSSVLGQPIPRATKAFPSLQIARYWACISAALLKMWSAADALWETCYLATTKAAQKWRGHLQNLLKRHFRLQKFLIFKIALYFIYLLFPFHLCYSFILLHFTKALAHNGTQIKKQINNNKEMVLHHTV